MLWCCVVMVCCCNVVLLFRCYVDMWLCCLLFDVGWLLCAFRCSLFSARCVWFAFVV